LSCYESDIQKADETGHEYFLKLIENIPESKKDLDLIKIAHSKLKQYSDNFRVLANTNQNMAIVPYIDSFL